MFTRWLGVSVVSVLLLLVGCTFPTDPHDTPSFDGPSFAFEVSSADAILAAGDIGRCNSTADEQTASLLDSLTVQYPKSTVVPLGDLVYPAGTATAFANCYTPSWGRFLPRTRAVIGNHEYDSSAVATPYFDYINGIGHADGRAGPRGKGYYSWSPNASWHVIVLNMNTSFVSTRPGTPQDTWLAQDLAANTRPCILALWHQPRFFSQSSGPLSVPPNNTSYPWERLYAARADLILNGHAHFYERFAQQRPDGTADTRGIRQIIAGTGGSSGATLTAIRPNSEVREGHTYGVLTVELRAGFYRWSFVPVAGKTFTDSGTTACHHAAGLPSDPPLPPPDSTPTSPPLPPPPPAPTIVLKTSGRVDATKTYSSLDWTGAVGDSVDVYRNASFIQRTLNDGHYVNSRSIAYIPISYTYKVCRVGTATCSNESTVRF